MSKSIQQQRRDARFTVAGQNAQGRWEVMHPSGNLCGGTWHSQQAAQADCDTWNVIREASFLS